MRRWPAAAVLLLFVGSPILQAWCAVDCLADDVDSTPVAHCHHEESTGAGVKFSASQHDCGAHLAPPAIAIAGRLFTAPMIGSTQLPTQVQHHELFRAIAPPACSSGGPPGAFAQPLRV